MRTGPADGATNGGGEMATIQIPVTALDEKCISCNAMDLEKQDYYANMEKIATAYQCRNLHLCQYIRNRIVRNEGKTDD